MPTDNAAPLEPSLITARSQMRHFYEELETLLKAHQPLVYVPFAAQRLRQSWDKNDMLAQSPPHNLLHSIEANCAYARRHRNEPMSWHRLARVMNVYHQHPPLLQLKAAQENLILLGLVMYREQMEIQYAHSRDAIARARLLFVVDDPIPRLSQEFLRTRGLSCDEWLRLGFLAFATAVRNEDGRFMAHQIANYEHLRMPPEKVTTFHSLSTLTPKEIGRRYRSTRDEVPLQFHSLIRSVFLERPIIDFGEGCMLAPHPPLILRHSTEGLYRMMHDLPHFDSEFGETVQRYVGRVLNAYHDKVTLLDSSRLERLTPGKSCDFLLETTDAVVLVEAKATSFAARLVTDTAMLNDNSTGKVAKGMEQLYATANDLAIGRLKSSGVNREKPVLGIVVTFGELPFANSDWYFETAFAPRARKRLAPPIYPSPNMQRRPVILSIPTLELLILAANNTKSSLLALHDGKQSENYVSVGDWDAYLRAKLRALDDEIKPLPFVEEECDAFCESLGPVTQTAHAETHLNSADPEYGST